MPQLMVMPKKYFFDKDGNPLAFGKIYTFQAETTNDKPTFTTEAGDVEHPNPIILNSEGFAAIFWSGSYNIVVDDQNDANIWSEDKVSSNTAEEWINCETPTFVNTTSFTIVGNVTDVYEEGRRVRINNGVPTLVYSTIKSSSFAAGVTTIVVDSAAIAAGITEVCVSIIGVNSRADNHVQHFDNLTDARNSTIPKENDVISVKVVTEGNEETTTDFDVTALVTEDIPNGIYTGISNINISFVMRDRDSLTSTTIAVAASRTDIKVGTKIHWQGYYVQSDGGSNWGIVKAGSPTPDGGSIFTIDANLYIEANLKGKKLSVRKFGARADSTEIGVGTDNSEFFKTTIAFGSSVHKVYVPGGELAYRISSTVYTNREGMSFVGESMQATVLNVDDGIIGVVGGNSPSTSEDIHDMLISDMHINGGTHALQLGSVTSPLTYIGEVSRVRLTSGSISGLNVHQMIANLNNVLFTENQIGMTSFNTANGGGFPTNSKLMHCRFFNNTNQGMWAEHMLGFNFDTCDFESNGKEGIVFAFVDAAGPWLRRVSFLNCHYEGNMTAGGEDSASVLFTASGVLEMKDVDFTVCNFAGVNNQPNNVNIRGKVTGISLINNLSIGPDIGGFDLTTEGAVGIFIGENLNDLVNLQKLQCISHTEKRLIASVGFDLVAFAGGGQANALELTKEINQVKTVASTDDSVKLPTAFKGLRVLIINKGLNALKVFPNVGDNLGNGLNIGASLAPEASIEYNCWDTVNWAGH